MKTSKGFLIAALLTGLSAAVWGIVAGAYGNSGDGDFLIQSLAITCPGHPACPVSTPWEIKYFDPADILPTPNQNRFPVMEWIDEDGTVTPLMVYFKDTKRVVISGAMEVEIRRIIKEELFKFHDCKTGTVRLYHSCVTEMKSSE